MEPGQINDVYFRRFLVPITITVLIMLTFAVLIATPPGTAVKWDTFRTVLGGVGPQVAGALRRARK